jgi:hypothetical protein
MCIPGTTRFAGKTGFSEFVAVMMMSTSRTASSGVRVTTNRTCRLANSSVISCASLYALYGWRLYNRTSFTGRTAITPRSCMGAWPPVPIRPTVCASRRASSFVASPVAAPVRSAVRYDASSRAIGSAVATSARTTVP